jgi:hypothetical protein
MKDEYLKGIGDSNFPKVTVPGHGPQKLQKVPSQEEMDRIRNEKKRPEPNVKVGVCKISIPPPLEKDADLEEPPGTAGLLSVLRGMGPQAGENTGHSLLSGNRAHSEQSAPDEEDLARIRREKARPAPAAPVRPPEPEPVPQSPPEKPKQKSPQE